MNKHVLFCCLMCLPVNPVWAALTWTGTGDAVSLYQEANWLDHSGSVPPAGTINPNTELTADSGGQMGIRSGAGTPGNFNGNFILAPGDDLRVANGKLLGGNDNVVGGGVGSVMTRLRRLRGHV